MKSAWITAAALVCCGTGALAATPARVPARTSAQGQPVNIVLSDFAFTPSALQLRQGQAYQLRLINRGSGGHNFSAPQFFAASQVNPDDRGLVAGGKVELGKGESRTIRLVPAAGRYRVTCTHFLHEGFGMVGSIGVN